MAEVFCPNCGYNLYGIPEVRCPECGFHYDHAAIVSIANDEAAVTRVLAGRVAVRTLFAVGCAAAPIVTALYWPGNVGLAVMTALFIGAAALRRYLTQADPFHFPEMVPRAAVWLGASVALSVFLLLLPRVASLTAAAILIDAWRIFLQCQRAQTLALLSLPARQQKRVARQTRWAGASLAVATLVMIGSWLY